MPHKIKVSVDKTALFVTVAQHYFKGNHYLVEADFSEDKIFFNHPEIVQTKQVYLKLRSYGK
ncbi:hypothetical protein [Marinirhabdus gelatinilytica]|uniref:hypothetical protein n=1 Tax=Marinirhabdus gelatinilytica TaxID=1703343 RepID=UPI0011C04C26|nr:hypothetical protein [Marinirhabdus gelatinilytica]